MKDRDDIFFTSITFINCSYLNISMKDRDDIFFTSITFINCSYLNISSGDLFDDDLDIAFSVLKSILSLAN